MYNLGNIRLTRIASCFFALPAQPCLGIQALSGLLKAPRVGTHGGRSGWPKSFILAGAVGFCAITGQARAVESSASSVTENCNGGVDVTLTNQVYDESADLDCDALESLTFGGEVEVQSGARVVLSAPIVRIVAPATIAAGAVFTADTNPVVENTIPNVRPQVLGAASQGNTAVVVSFSESMGYGATNPANYVIVQENTNPEVGALGVVSVSLSANGMSATLTTRSQNEITYRVTVNDVLDAGGEPLDMAYTVGGAYPVNTALFPGTPPVEEELVDSDGDGLFDNEEQFGYLVFVELGNGEVTATEVTSDPAKYDTDGDGLNDYEEVQIGTSARKKDSDGDGLEDEYEWNTVLSDPLAQDTDLDGLGDGSEHSFWRTSAVLADTDGDQLSDSRELLELNRNPRIADLPEIGIRIGEVRLQIDERYTYTNEYGETVSQESSSNTTLSQSESNATNDMKSGNVEWTAGAEVRAGIGSGNFFGGSSNSFSGGVEVTAGLQSTWSDGWQTDETSASEAQEVYEQSLSKGSEFTTTSSVTREVVDARIDLDLTIDNLGDIPFTVSNIEITVLQMSRIDTTRLVPVATLVANSELITGTPLAINLGPFNPERGPFLFTSRDVFPNLVEGLMKNPDGLVFRVANYDVTDELGRNYAFADQITRDRTGGVGFDFGDAADAKYHLVAISGVLDIDGVVGPQGDYVGGWDATGKAKPLPLDFVLQDILGMNKHRPALDEIRAGPDGNLDSLPQGDDVLNGDRILAGPNGYLESRPAAGDSLWNPNAPTGILAGPNRTADSLAQGDDIQLIPQGTTGVSVGAIVIDPGVNGLLDSPVQKDDMQDFVSLYETRPTCNAGSKNQGDSCTEDAKCIVGDDGSGGSCSGPERLVRIDTLRNGDYNRAWVVLTSGDLPAAADFGSITLGPRQDITLGFLQDLDRDGLFAREEFLYGSIDSSIDQLDNSRFGEIAWTCDPLSANAGTICSSDGKGTIINECLPHPVTGLGGICRENFDDTLVEGEDGIPDSRDSDRDGLDDFAEVLGGWKVSLDGGPLYPVFSSPRLRDSDGDGLLDPVEADLRRFCDPADARSTALCAFQSLPPVTRQEAVAIIAGPNGVADTTIVSNDDERLDLPDVVAYGTPIVGPGPDGVIDTTALGDDRYASATEIPPATDPSGRDTDLDNLPDAEELVGLEVGLAIVDGGNAVADTSRNGDDIQKVSKDNPVWPGGIIILPGPNGAIDSPWIRMAPPDDEIATERRCGFVCHDYQIITCGPNRVADSIAIWPDEQRINPGGKCASASDIVVSTVFTLSPFDSPTKTYLLTTPENNHGNDDYLRVARPVVTDPLRRDTDDDTNSDGLEMVIGSDPTVADGGDFRDSDQDGLTDREEDSLGWKVTVNGNPPYDVLSSPSLPDTDFDGLPDFIERDLRTDPNKTDTDNDGLSDFDEMSEDQFAWYVSVASQYPGVSINGGSSKKYSTDPVLADTDGDGLSDYFELLEGYPLLLPGAPTYVLRKTNPLLADSDYDGANDMEEKSRSVDGNPAPTDAMDPDTDGDGRLDGVEIATDSVTDPLVRDSQVTVRFTMLTLKGGGEDGEGYTPQEWGWTFHVRTPNNIYPGELISNAKRFYDANTAAYGYDSTCKAIQAGSYNTFDVYNSTPKSEISFALREGEFTSVTFNLRELDGCENSTDLALDCDMWFQKNYTYNELENSFGFGELQELSGGGCSASINYEIFRD
jgi:hypothetical protein